MMPRGPKRKPIDEIRWRCFSVSMNTKEGQQLDELARIYDCSLAEIMRRAIAEKYDRDIGQAETPA